VIEHACHLHAHDKSWRLVSLGALAVPGLPSSVHSPDARLPVGVALRKLPCSHDCGQEATQVYRADWRLNLAPVQWNLVASKPNTLRGVHVHTDHWDYLHTVDGEMLLGLHDLRPWSPTYRLAAQLRLTSDWPIGVAIPPGVAHGFYFAVLTRYFYALSHYWAPSDDLGCRWDDPELGISWPTSDPLLSPRDASAQSYRALARELASREIACS
jgi:dTDP-4-dehydrorhamnose 3,5-epimerase